MAVDDGEVRLPLEGFGRRRLADGGCLLAQVHHVRTIRPVEELKAGKMAGKSTSPGSNQDEALKKHALYSKSSRESLLIDKLMDDYSFVLVHWEVYFTSKCTCSMFLMHLLLFSWHVLPCHAFLSVT